MRGAEARKKKEPEKKEPAKGGSGKKPPKKPPKAPPGDDGHEDRVKAIHEKIDQGLQEANITDEQRTEFGTATKSVLSHMTQTAVQRFHDQVKEIKYYPTPKALTEAVKAKYPKMKLTGARGMFDRDGVLHLSGGGDYHGKPATVEELYAHEMAHAIDGPVPPNRLSDTDEWKKIWEEELAKAPLMSDAAKKNPHEAWAEIGMHLLDPTVGVKYTKDFYPKAVKYWKKHDIA